MTIPFTDSQVSLQALKAWIRDGTILAALEAFHAQLGDIFQFNLPGFKPIMMVGPEANKLMLVTQPEQFLWREERDPVAQLLRQGVLVVDGKDHDLYRNTMLPAAMHKNYLQRYVEAMWQCTDEVTATWKNEVDMLVEMRKVALLILIDTLFGASFSPDMQRMWKSILRCIDYISPGVWMLWRGVPRPGYQKYLAQMDQYLFHLIQMRRKSAAQDDMLSMLINAGLSDDVIRDQLLTMLIAGHDTSTALLAWTFYFFGKRPEVMEKARSEVLSVIGDGQPLFEHVKSLKYLGNVIDETLRLYPPIHLGSRTAASDIEFQGHVIPVGQRVLYSIFLVQRDPKYWNEPKRFNPDRFAAGKPEPYTYLPFGGGERNCIGVAFGNVEAKIVLARILQKFELTLLPQKIHPHMGATLEPRPGVRMRVKIRH